MTSRLYAAGYSPGVPHADVETAIRNLTQDFCMAYNTGNYDQAANLFAPDGVFMPPHAEAVFGPRPIERALQKYSEAGIEDVRLETLRVEFSGDIAMEIGRYRMVVRRSDGTAQEDRGHFLANWRRMGAWRILASCWSTSLSVQEPSKSESRKPNADAA